MYRVFIADDESWILERLVTTIDWQSIGAEVVGRSMNGREAYEKISGQQIDVLITDIRMPEIDGLELIEEVRKQQRSIKCIIISGYSDFSYARKAIQEGVSDYILKPVNYYAFSLKLKYVLQILASKQTDTIIICNQSGKFRIALNTLRYVEVVNHTLHYHTLSECITATGSPSLGKLTESLTGKGFVRSHHGYLVNLHYVTHYDKTSICVKDDSIPLSRSYYKNFVQQLLAYCGG